MANLYLSNLPKDHYVRGFLSRVMGKYPAHVARFGGGRYLSWSAYIREGYIMGDSTTIGRLRMMCGFDRRDHRIDPRAARGGPRAWRQAYKAAGMLATGRKCEIPTSIPLSSMEVLLYRSLREVHTAVYEGRIKTPDIRKVLTALRPYRTILSLEMEGSTGCLIGKRDGMYIRDGYTACSFLAATTRPPTSIFVEPDGSTRAFCERALTGDKEIDECAPSTVDCALGLDSWFEENDDYEWNEDRNRWEHVDYEEPRSRYEDDDEDEDEDSESDDGLYEYHSCGRERNLRVRLHESAPGDSLKGDKLTLGFEAEIEIEGRYKAIERINSDPLLSHVCILEEDGSLSSRTGFEMVTGWSTLHTVSSWGQRFCEIVSDYEYDTSNAGLHIAAGGLSKLHVARIYGFVFDEFNRPLLRDLAGRDYNSYAGKFTFRSAEGHDYWRALDRQPLPRARKVAAHTAKLIRHEYSDRYTALNYRMGASYEGTLEFRLFAGTGNATRMQARLQFVWALCKYTDPALCNQLTVEGFLNALVSDPHLRRHTQVLREYIVRTQEHKARYPLFSNGVSKIKTKENKKLLFEQSKKAQLAIAA